MGPTRACIALPLLALFFVSPLTGQGIVGSAHDFRSGIGNGWYNSDEICIPCHTPHAALYPETPLWNHELTTATFTLYSSATLDATDLTQPGRTSKLCLSCHDGTVALDSWGGAQGTILWPSGHNKVMGTDLSNDHPISFTYDSGLAVADPGLRDPASPSGLGGSITDKLLKNSKVECVSCHDVHDAAGLPNLVWVTMDNSQLCLVCHSK